MDRALLAAYDKIGINVPLIVRLEGTNVEIARKMLADPEIPIKLAAGRPQDIRPCIYCYACVSQIFVNQSVKCSVNAQTGMWSSYFCRKWATNCSSEPSRRCLTRSSHNTCLLGRGSRLSVFARVNESSKQVGFSCANGEVRPNT